MIPHVLWYGLTAGLVALASFSSQSHFRMEFAKQGTVGVEEGDGSLVFGKVADVAADSLGNVFVLDARFNNLRVFDASGRFVARTGRPGQGPGEFAVPRALALLQNGRIAVLDEGNRRVAIYELRKRSLTLLTNLGVGRGGEDLCALGNDLVVYGFINDRVLRRFAPDGRLIATFAKPADTSKPLLVQQLEAQGPIVCVPDNNLIVYTSRFSPLVVAVYGDGRFAWRATLANFSQVEITATKPRGFRYSMPKQRHYHRVRTAFLASPGVVALQIENTVGAGAGEKVANLETRYLSIVNGGQLGVQLDAPPLAMTSGNRGFGLREDPFPAFITYRTRVAAAGR